LSHYLFELCMKACSAREDQMKEYFFKIWVKW